MLYWSFFSDARYKSGNNLEDIFKFTAQHCKALGNGILKQQPISGILAEKNISLLSGL